MARRYDVLLADADEEYRLLMKPIIESTGEFRLAAHTGSGAEALELARRLRPDAVIADAVLPDMDGFALMDSLAGLTQGFVMATGHCRQSVLLEVIRREMFLFLPKPFQNDALLAVLRRACGGAEEYRVSALWERRVTRALHAVGVPAHIKGYPYVRRAVLLAMEKPELLHALTKELYPTLARQFSTTPACVERAIRSAVEAAWMRGNPEIQRDYFTMDKPSNGSFIAAISAKVQADLSDTVA